MSKNKRSSPADNFVLIRGGGDLATGVALRLHRSGIKVVISELAQPLAVRRTVSFSEAVYEGSHTVEGVTARLIEPLAFVHQAIAGALYMIVAAIWFIPDRRIEKKIH